MDYGNRELLLTESRQRPGMQKRARARAHMAAIEAAQAEINLPPPAVHGRRSTLVREYTNEVTEGQWQAARKPPSAPLNDSIADIISQCEPSKVKPHGVLPKRQNLSADHPAARLLSAPTSGGPDALSEFIMQRHGSRYGKKAAQSAYQRQIMDAMGNQLRAPILARVPSIPAAGITQQARTHAAVAVRKPPDVWTYGALGGLPR